MMKSAYLRNFYNQTVLRLVKSGSKWRSHDTSHAPERVVVCDLDALQVIRELLKPLGLRVEFAREPQPAQDLVNGTSATDFESLVDIWC
jgi:hypothetical protein